jgi:two-component system cell cycle response regulator DivK
LHHELAELLRIFGQVAKAQIGQHFRSQRIGLEAGQIGSRFRVWKCIDVTAPLRQYTGPAGNPGGTEGDMPKTVMIVEDNELNMKLFNDLLESRGYNIIQTRNGMEALGLARAHHPDLILMDIQLPEVSGLVVTKWLKEDDDLASIPVIAVTAFAMKGDEERILQGGCEGYISKPISVPHFLETIQRYIGPA